MKFNQTIYDQYVEQGSMCLYCAREIPYEEITRDHFKPKSAGETLIKNKVYSCKKCNSMKGTKNLIEFRDFVLEKIKKELRKLVLHRFKMSDKSYKDFLYFHKCYMQLIYLINNSEKIKLFT